MEKFCLHMVLKFCIFQILIVFFKDCVDDCYLEATNFWMPSTREV